MSSANGCGAKSGPRPRSAGVPMDTVLHYKAVRGGLNFGGSSKVKDTVRVPRLPRDEGPIMKLVVWCSPLSSPAWRSLVCGVGCGIGRLPPRPVSQRGIDISMVAYVCVHVAYSAKGVFACQLEAKG